MHHGVLPCHTHTHRRVILHVTIKTENVRHMHGGCRRRSLRQPFTALHQSSAAPCILRRLGTTADRCLLLPESKAGLAVGQPPAGLNALLVLIGTEVPHNAHLAFIQAAKPSRTSASQTSQTDSTTSSTARPVPTSTHGTSSSSSCRHHSGQNAGIPKGTLRPSHHAS